MAIFNTDPIRGMRIQVEVGATLIFVAETSP